MQALSRSRISHALAVALAVAMCASTVAAATAVATQYQRIQAREKAARATVTPVAATLRAVAKSYEAFTRAHPVSGYADNALWQAAGLYETVFARTKDRKDADQVTRLLTWLKKEYPTGTLAKQADARLKLTATPAASAAAPAPAPASAPVKATPPKPAETMSPREPENGTPSAAVVSVPLPALPAPAAAAARVPAIMIQDVTYGLLPRGDRVTIELNAEVAYATSRTDNPDRVFVELINAGATAPIVDRASKISGPLLKSLTVTKSANGTARIVLQLAGKPRFSTFPLYDPFRLVIDVESDALPAAAAAPAMQGVVAKSVARTSFATSASPTPASADPPAVAPVPAASTSAGDYSLARQLGLGVSRVVIDPGHGGHDPGAQANGLSEAALVLDVALRLEALLVRRGVDVVLTRRTDAYVQLEERTAIANRADADMFISIHANASPQAGARGVETFFLDFATNPHAQAVAARENAASTQAMRVLPELVKTIAMTNKLQESKELASMVQTSLARKLQAQNKGVADLGVKRAPFVVLIGAQMPSVLAEVSFVTNRSDASLLKQMAYRDRIAQALADAVVKYQGSLKTGTMVATRNAP